MKFDRRTLACLALLVSRAIGHLIMQNPIPFGVDTLNNSPLANAAPGSAGSDFPCKQRPGVYDITAMNHMVVGDTQELNFTGSASHGGGTCQIITTMDLEPDVKSTWKIIQVYEGGCPTSGNGNGGTDPFTFTIPKGYPNGRSTLGWVWYNKIGNREIYFNCGPLDITGGSDSQDFWKSLPNAYFINLPSSDCSSIETTDVTIPNPGQFILKGPSNTLKAASGPSCSASAAAQTSGVVGYKSNVLSNGAAYGAPANGGNDETAAPASSDVQATIVSSGNTQATAISSASILTSDIVTMSYVSAAATTSTPPDSSSYPTMTVTSDAGIFGPSTAASASAPLGTGTATDTSTGTGTGSACSGDAVACSSGGDQFGLCDHGFIVWQKVADGTKCVNGAIVKRNTLRNVHVRRHLALAPQHHH